MRQNFNRFPTVFVWSAIATVAVFRALSLVWVELGVRMSKSKLDKEGKGRRPHTLMISADSADALVANALRRFQARYIEDRLRTPEELKIIETPLGFEPK